MDISTGSWFKYLREEVLTEGLRDIGLPEFVIDYLEDAMPDTSEKARMYIANNWKNSRGGMAGHMTIPSLQYEVITFLMGDMFRDYIISNEKFENTGYTTKFSLDDGIRELVKGYQMIRNTRYGNL